MSKEECISQVLVRTKVIHPLLTGDLREAVSAVVVMRWRLKAVTEANALVVLYIHLELLIHQKDRYKIEC